MAGSHEVRGSIPLGSTTYSSRGRDVRGFFVGFFRYLILRLSLNRYILIPPSR